MLARGFDTLAQQLRRVGTEIAVDAGKAAVRRGLESLQRDAFSQIDGLAVSPALKFALRATVGISMHIAEHQAGVVISGKMGFGVGRPQPVSRSQRKGVGISSRNVHWFALGTADRFQGLRQRRIGRTDQFRRRKTGRPIRFVGRIEPIQVISRVYAGGSDATRLAAAIAFRETLANMGIVS